LSIQSDLKVLVGGNFISLGGGGTGTNVRYNIGRLNANGSLDRSPDFGANASVRSLALDADARILLGGSFTNIGSTFGTTTRNHIARLFSNGSLDAGFDPGSDNDVFAILRQPDGKILLGGSFTTLGGGGTGITPRNHIGRLNPDGSIDTSFNPGAN